MSSKRVALLLAALFCLFAVAPSVLFAQNANTGTVAGTVTDPSGGAVVGATVTLTDTATNISRAETTNETGRYFFASVVPGNYNLSVSKTGFRVSKLSGQTVMVGAALTLNIVMELGSVAETVEVTVTAGAELQTMNATVGNTIGGDTLKNLPTIQRDAATFVTLQPGVSPDGSVAGAVVDQSTFLLDGGQNTNDMDGSMNVYTPSFAGDPTGRNGWWRPHWCYADSSRQRRRVQSEHRQPNRRLQQLRRRRSPGGHQTRHQYVAWHCL